jgi:hypothetical protein
MRNWLKKLRWVVAVTIKESVKRSMGERTLLISPEAKAFWYFTQERKKVTTYLLTLKIWIGLWCTKGWWTKVAGFTNRNLRIRTIHELQDTHDNGRREIKKEMKGE